MSTAPLPLRPTAPRHWWPMSDDQWEALSRILHRGRGRPPRNARLTWDGIFWIACSKEPWSALPPAFGKPDTAHRTLRRAAKAMLLHAMLVEVSDLPAFAASKLRPIAWYIVRAFRRAFRIAPGAIAFAQRLGLASALPAAPIWLPNPDLSERVRAIAQGAKETIGGRTVEGLKALLWLAERAGGRPEYWRTTE